MTWYSPPASEALTAHPPSQANKHRFLFQRDDARANVDPGGESGEGRLWQRAGLLLGPALAPDPQASLLGFQVLKVEARHLTASQAEVEHQPDQSRVTGGLQRRLRQRLGQHGPCAGQTWAGGVPVGLDLEPAYLGRP
jgi:hypothetical protein